MKNVIRKTWVLLVVVYICGAGVLSAAALDESVLSDIDALIKERQYLSAAELINKQGTLSDPKLIRRYVHTLTRHYIATDDFSTFIVKNLKPDEDLEAARDSYNNKNNAGTGSFVVNIDKLLYQQLSEHAKSPDLQFSIGDYLSSYVACNCHTTMYFKSKGDAGYYQRAYLAGIYNDWSLLRIGQSLLMSRSMDDKKRLLTILNSHWRLTRIQQALNIISVLLITSSEI